MAIHGYDHILQDILKDFENQTEGLEKELSRIISEKIDTTQIDASQLKSRIQDALKLATRDIRADKIDKISLTDFIDIESNQDLKKYLGKMYQNVSDTISELQESLSKKGVSKGYINGLKKYAQESASEFVAAYRIALARNINLDIPELKLDTKMFADLQEQLLNTEVFTKNTVKKIDSYLNHIGINANTEFVNKIRNTIDRLSPDEVTDLLNRANIKFDEKHLLRAMEAVNSAANDVAISLKNVENVYTSSSPAALNYAAAQNAVADALNRVAQAADKTNSKSLNNGTNVIVNESESQIIPIPNDNSVANQNILQEELLETAENAAKVGQAIGQTASVISNTTDTAINSQDNYQSELKQTTVLEQEVGNASVQSNERIVSSLDKASEKVQKFAQYYKALYDELNINWSGDALGSLDRIADRLSYLYSLRKNEGYEEKYGNEIVSLMDIAQGAGYSNFKDDNNVSHFNQVATKYFNNALRFVEARKLLEESSKYNLFGETETIPAVISSPTQAFDNEIQQNLVSLKNYKNTLVEISNLKVQPQTEAVKAKFEELNKLADYFASKITAIRGENNYDVSPSMMKLNGQYAIGLREKYTSDQLDSFWEVANDRSGLQISSVSTEFVNIQNEIELIESKSEGLRQSLTGVLLESDKYVKELKYSFISLAETTEALQQEKNPKWIEAYQRDIDSIIAKYPELKQLKDDFNTESIAREFIKSDQWNAFLATLPQAHEYLASIGYDLQNINLSTTEKLATSEDHVAENAKKAAQAIRDEQNASESNATVDKINAEAHAEDAKGNVIEDNAQKYRDEAAALKEFNNELERYNSLKATDKKDADSFQPLEEKLGQIKTLIGEKNNLFRDEEKLVNEVAQNEANALSSVENGITGINNAQKNKPQVAPTTAPSYKPSSDVPYEDFTPVINQLNKIIDLAAAKNKLFARERNVVTNGATAEANSLQALADVLTNVRDDLKDITDKKISINVNGIKELTSGDIKKKLDALKQALDGMPDKTVNINLSGIQDISIEDITNKIKVLREALKNFPDKKININIKSLEDLEKDDITNKVGALAEKLKDIPDRAIKIDVGSLKDLTESDFKAKLKDISDTLKDFPDKKIDIDISSLQEISKANIGKKLGLVVNLLKDFPDRKINVNLSSLKDFPYDDLDQKLKSIKMNLDGLD